MNLVRELNEKIRAKEDIIESQRITIDEQHILIKKLESEILEIREEWKKDSNLFKTKIASFSKQSIEKNNSYMA